MTRLEEVLQRLDRRLGGLGVQWALVGGLAVSARGEARTTRDIDVAVAVGDDREAELLIRSFFDRGYQLYDQLEQKKLERLATVRLLPPDEPSDGVVVDFLFASSGIEPEVARGGELLKIGDVGPVPVATIGHLIAMKIVANSARRPHDAYDIRALLQVASEADIEEALSAIDLITSRGYGRDRNLRTELNGFLQEEEDRGALH